MTAWILLGVGLVLVVLTGIYVAAEFSLVTVDRATVDRAAADGDRRAAAVKAALRRLSTHLSGAQVGITATTLALGYVMEPSLAALLIPPLRATGLPPGVASTTAVVVALLVATAVSMVFGELVPKNLAIAGPLAVARRVVRANAVTTAVCAPLIWALNGAANGVLRLVGIEPQEELRSTRTAQELQAAVRRSAAHGTLEAPSAQLVTQSLAFSSKFAGDVLTPRVDVVGVFADEPVSAVITAAASSDFSRFPVLGDGIDDIVGLVHVKRAVAVPRDDRDTVTIASRMDPAPVVPETLPLDDLLALLREDGLQMVVVVDEYGGTAGIVTLEDVIEELVGEIVDEHDTDGGRCVRHPDGTYLLSAALRPDEVADLTGVALPEPDEYETVAGLVLEHLDHLPQPGDAVRVPAAVQAGAALGAAPGGTGVDADPHTDVPREVTVRLTVTRMAGRRIRTVRLAAVHPGPPENADRAGGTT